MPASTNRSLPVLHTRASIEAASWNAEERTIDVVFATETPVRRFDWEDWEEFDEVLDVSPSAMDLSRAGSGLPVFKDHRASVDNQLGRADKIRIDGKRAIATIRFTSNPAHAPLIEDIRSGLINNISVGYRVLEYTTSKKKADGSRAEYRATRWMPLEISVVGVPADPNSQTIRSATEPSTHFPVIIKDETMSEKPIEPIADDKQPKPGIDADALRQAAEAERLRCLEIRNIGRRAGLSDAFIDEHISKNTAIEKVRELAFDALAAKEHKPRAGVQYATVGDDNERNAMREAMSDALILRSGAIAGYDEKLEKQDKEKRRLAEQYRHLSLKDLARKCLEKSREYDESLHPLKLAERAFTSTTGDFPNILDGTNRRILLENYAIQLDKWRQICIVGAVGDFREYKRLRKGSLPNLTKIAELQEYETLPLKDGNYERIKIGTYGNTINVSRQMIINDDLQAFASLAADLGRSAARTIDNTVWALLESNPEMGDGERLFSAAHNNVGTIGTAPSIAAFDVIRTAMSEQRDPNGNDYLDIQPHTIAIHPSLRSKVDQINKSMYDLSAATATFTPNVVEGMFKQIVDTPKLTNRLDYYVFADKAIIPTLEVAFLNGVQEPFMETQTGFHVDGQEWKIRLDFGVAAIDWRGAYKQIGA
jgi:HK97 family phage prohead protease